MPNEFTFVSLFAGIGGFDKGLERAGWECEGQVEIDEHATKVLEKHWPEVLRFRDVRECGKHNLPQVDLICGGVPCQPVSRAGKHKAQADERWLWPEFTRIVCGLKPRWVLAENVEGLLSVNSGRAFGEILRDLANCGYHVTWQVLSARAFGAPHLRRRVFLVANRDSERIKGFWQKEIQRLPEFSWCKNVRGIEDLQNRPNIPEPLIRRTNNGISRRMDAIGNAVIPGIIQWIGERMIELDSCVNDES